MSLSVPVSSAFVSADIDLDPNQLVTDSLTQFNALLEAAGLPGWNPSDADLLVILLNTVAVIAADVNTTASTVIPAIFRNFGQLLGISYQTGTTAQVTATFEYTSAAPDSVSYVIPSGTAVIVSGSAFYTSTTWTAHMGDTSATLLLTAADAGSSYNGLGGIGDGFPDVSLNNPISFVATVTTTALTSGGADPETDDDYQNRLVSELQLQAPRPITASDFAQFVNSDICESATGVAVGRSTAIDGFYPAARTLSTGGSGPAALTATGNVASGSANATITTGPYLGAIPFPTATVTGTDIPTNTTILASPAPTATTFTMSANASATLSNDTFTISEWQNVGRCTTVFVTDDNGNALTNAQMDALQAWLATYREVNFQVYVEPPTYNTVYVNARIHVLPSFVGSEAAVEAAVQTALTRYFNPYLWGNVGSVGQSWLNSSSGFNVIRYTALYGVIEAVQGVQYVTNGTLTLGFSASPSGTSDITMAGAAPLPQATTSSINISCDN